jgi:predicted RecB family nuclease
MKPQLTDVGGIGPSMARALEAQGIRTVAALAKAGVDKVTAARGFGETRAAGVIAAAAALLAAAGAPQAATGRTPSSQGKKKAAKKPKIKKEKKKKNGKKKKGKKKK